jgi:hypothetical protein
MSETKQVVELTKEEFEFLRWAVKHHHWSDVMSVVRYTPNEEYTGYHLDEIRVLEGLFAKFGLSDEEITQHEAEHWARPSKRFLKEVTEAKLNPRFIPKPSPEQVKERSDSV